MTESELPVRLAGRVIAIDPAGRVLLFGYDDPPPKGKHWATPGGGVEDGEDFYTAARRELFEETGWPDVPVSPQEAHLESNVQYSGYRKALIRQYDHYFVGRVPEEKRPLGEVAAMHTSDGIVGHRWWTLEELDVTEESVYPKGLADLVRRLRLPARQLVDELLRVDRADAGDQVVALAGGVALDRDRLAVRALVTRSLVTIHR